VSWWLARVRANLAANRAAQAVRAATEAVRLQPASAGAMIELARAHVAYAERSRDAGERRQHVDGSVVAAREAVRLEPRRDDGYAVLMRLYTPGGVAADASRRREIRAALRAANPKSRLLATLDAQEDLRRGRVERGLQRLVVLCDADPTDTLSLDLAVAAWVQTGREDEALEWFDQKLQSWPGDPVLLDQWVTQMLRKDRSSEAIRRLQGVLSEEPAHDAARRTLETLYRRGGLQAEALPLGEQRLLSRPQGIRRELELAAMYAGVGRDDVAVEHLGWVLDHADDADFDHMVTALNVAGRLSDSDARHDPLTLEVAERTVQRFPEAPLQVYGTALRALARLDRIDQHFDDLADRAVRYARGASGASLQEADVWRQLAQALVNAEQAEAASRALRARLWAEAALDRPARVLLVRAVLTSDAAANRVEATIDLVNRLALRGWLPPTPGEESEPTVSDVLYEISIVRLEPDHPMALNNLGYTHVERDDAGEQAEAWVTRALELRPDDNNVLDSMGWLRYKQGKFAGDEQAPGAIELIRESLARGQAEQAPPEVLDHLGDVLWRLGDHDAASDAWRRAVEILEDDEWQQQRGREYLFFQARIWGLLVSEPGEIHERQYGVLLENVREKLRLAQQAGMPPVAATFEELQQRESSGDVTDGRP